MKKQSWREGAFFGLHFDIHADVGDTDIGRGLTKEHLVAELSKIKPDYIQCDCKGHRGFTSWPTKVGTPSPGIVNDALRIWSDAARELGVPIVMHYSGVWDYAAILAHPEYGRVNATGGGSARTPGEVNDLGRDSNMTCPLSRYTQDIMIKQMIEVIDNYGVNGFWVDGECWASEPCYCEACVAEYRRRVGGGFEGGGRGSESSIGSGGETGSGDETGSGGGSDDDTGKDSGSCAGEGAGSGNDANNDIVDNYEKIPTSAEDENWWDWLAYQSENFESHVREYTDAVHAHAPDVAICSNWMYTLRQPDDITAPVDYISGDFSWIWSINNAETEARFIANRGMDWELMAWGFTNYGKGMSDWVFKTLPALCQEAAVVLSCGGKFLVYDSPERTCRIIPWHMDILAQVADFCRARQAWHGGTSAPQAAVLHDPDTYYKKSIPLYNLGDGALPVEGALAALLDTGYDGDILNDSAFFARMAEYPVCVVPAAAGAAVLAHRDRMRKYTESGGILVLSGLNETDAYDDMLGVGESNGGGECTGAGDNSCCGDGNGDGDAHDARDCDSDCADNGSPHTIWSSSSGGRQLNLLLDGGSCIAAHGQWRRVEAEICEVVAPLFWGRDPATGIKGDQPVHPGIAWRSLGKGAVVGFFGPFLETYAYARYPGFRTLFADALRAAGAERRLCKLYGPAHVHIGVMEKDGATLVHIYNTGSATPNTPKSPYIEDVPRVYDLRLGIPADKPPKSVRLAPSGDPVTWSYSNGTLEVRVESIYIYEILEIRH